MLAILQAYIDVALTRLGPQHMPRSAPLLWLTIAAGAGLALVPVVSGPNSTVQNFVRYALNAGMVTSVVWLLLNAMDRRERFLQTATALFGAELILTLLKLGVLFAFSQSFANVAAPEDIEFSGPLMILFALEAWSLAVMSFILRAALSIGVLQSMGIIVLIIMLFFGAASLVLPLLAPAI